MEADLACTPAGASKFESMAHGPWPVQVQQHSGRLGLRCLRPGSAFRVIALPGKGFRHAGWPQESLVAHFWG